MEYIDETRKLYADELVEKFKEGMFSVWLDNLSNHNKRNLAILLNNQMNYVNRLTEVQLNGIRPWDVLDFTCQEFKKLVAVYPENIFALPTAIAAFQYYDKAGEKKTLQVSSSLQEKGDKVELTDTLQNYFEKNFCLEFKKEDFKIFPLLLWVLPFENSKISTILLSTKLHKPQDYWFGATMIVPEGKPKEDEVSD